MQSQPFSFHLTTLEQFDLQGLSAPKMGCTGAYEALWQIHTDYQLMWKGTLSLRR